MNTPTPRTDAEHAQFPMGGFTLDFARRLERELTAMTEQRDGLHELHNKNAARSRELLEFCGTLRKELTAMTEQRDEAWKAIDLLKTNLRIQTELTENAVQDRADEHIELHNQIHELIEQRDRLAEALKEIYNVSAFDYDSMPEAARKKYREVVFAIADKALQSLNQPTL